MKRGSGGAKPPTKQPGAKKKQPRPTLPVRPTPDMYADSERFRCTPQTLAATLEEHGVAILPALLDAAECRVLQEGVWHFFEHITSGWKTPFRHADPASWNQLFSLLPSHAMLHQHWSIGHAQFAWDARQNPKVVGAFAALWQCEPEELIVSFDGSSYHLPPETTKRGWYKGNSWLHTDQRLSDSRFLCAQSWVTPLEVRPGDATLTFLHGSHKHHAEFAERFGLKGLKKDWHMLETQAEHDFFFEEKQCAQRCVACPAGSLVLWDSRTMHCGIEAMADREGGPNERMAIYVCMVPRRRADPKQMRKKQDAFQQLRTTSHWPERAKLFGKFPRTYGAHDLPNVTQIGPPKLTELGMKLAGF